MTKRLDGKRILVTQADDYMGPAIIDMFRKHGAEVIEDRSDLTDKDAAEKVISEAGRIDVLIANLAANARFGVSVMETDQEAWASMFDVMVHPLHRLTRAVLPQMIERRKGKVIVVGSATGLRGMAGVTAYSTARHAQVGYIRSTSLEVAQFNVQLNLIAQNWVENPAYFPPEFVATPEFQEVFKTVPMPRLATPEEDALFALFLASDESDFFVGQAIPFSGGWVQ
jgi:NAD(P)-dependent dehydrogenase (short-subunit alcohol dehydrogenase family)